MTHSIRFLLHFVLVVVWLALFICAVSSQATKSAPWIRINGPKNDLSAEVPGDNLYYKDGNRAHFFAKADRMWVNMEIYLERDARDHLKGISVHRKRKDLSCAEISVAHSVGEFCSYQKVGYVVTINMATPHALYQIWVAANSSDDASLQKVLSSMKVEGQPLFNVPRSASSGSPAEVSLSSIKPSDLVLNALNSRPKKPPELNYDFGGSSEVELDTIKYSRPLIMLLRPHAPYTGRARSQNLQGTVKLRVEFEGTGQI
ncbi:MAG: hypothetical protein ACRD43_01545, partial [Pyrinomonadaceae bacterium]